MSVDAFDPPQPLSGSPGGQSRPSWPVRLDRPRISPVYRLRCSLRGAEGESVADVLGSAQETILDWLQSKLPEALPDDARLGGAFRVHVPGQRIEGASIDAHGIWAVRLEHPDMARGGTSPVPGRTWITDVAIRLVDDADLLLGVQVLCASPPATDTPFAYTVPSFVRQLSQRLRLEAGGRLRSKTWTLATDEDLRDLFWVLVHPDRCIPVVVLTQPDQARLRLNVRPFLLDEDKLASWLVGTAIVVTLPSRLATTWTQFMGRTWSVYNGAVRIYRPGLDMEEDSPYEHPLFTAERVLATAYRGKTSEDAFQYRLIDLLRRGAAERIMDWRDIVFLDQTHTILREASSSALSQSDRLHMLEHEVRSLTEDRDSALDEAIEYEMQVIALREVNSRLNVRIATLEQQLRRIGASDTIAEDRPTGYQDIPDWVATRFAQQLVLAPRAIRALGRARFGNIGLVADAITLLAGPYRNMRMMGGLDARTIWESELERLRLTFGRSISESRRGEEGDTYMITYPWHSARKVFLEWKLSNGGNRNPERCLRVYFYWDEDENIVVIGWLPSHLHNRKS